MSTSPPLRIRVMDSHQDGTANLDPDALPRKILSARSTSTTAKGITRQYQVLTNLNLPGLSFLLSEPQKCSPWKAFIKKHLGFTLYLTFLEECDDCYVNQCAFKPLHTAPIGRSPLGIPSLLVWITLATTHVHYSELNASFDQIISVAAEKRVDISHYYNACHVREILYSEYSEHLASRWK